jgi:maleylpyruvate isomerase
MTSDRPTELIIAAVAGHRRIMKTVERMRDDEFERPSRLPSWSRADVVAWLTLKTRSHVDVFAGGMVDEVRSQFPDGYDQPAAVRQEASQGAAGLRSSLGAALCELEIAWTQMSDELWSRQAVATAGPRSMAEMVARHLRDLEAHHVDLDIGYEPSDWPPEFVDVELAKRLRDLERRADRAALLAWLLDRGPAPNLGPW